MTVSPPPVPKNKLIGEFRVQIIAYLPEYPNTPALDQNFTFIIEDCIPTVLKPVFELSDMTFAFNESFSINLPSFTEEEPRCGLEEAEDVRVTLIFNGATTLPPWMKYHPSNNTIDILAEKDESAVGRHSFEVIGGKTGFDSTSQKFSITVEGPSDEASKADSSEEEEDSTKNDAVPADLPAGFKQKVLIVPNLARAIEEKKPILTKITSVGGLNIDFPENYVPPIRNVTEISGSSDAMLGTGRNEILRIRLDTVQEVAEGDP